ncbi:MAG: LysR family transcriptional regulator [Pseudomonadota bacterium]
MDLNDVAVFEKVVSAGSLAAAAKRLSQPKSSVSRALSRREAEQAVTQLQEAPRGNLRHICGRFVSLLPDC